MIKKFIVLILIITLFSSACNATSGSTPSRSITLTVFAASSLADAFNEIGASFGVDHPGTKVEFNFAGSQQLRQQLAQGAPADVFASANDKEMTAVIDAGLILSGTQKIFVLNRLIVILPQNNSARIHTLHDLAKSGLKIILAAPGVPVGGYSLIALSKMNIEFGAMFSATVMSNVVSYEDNVKQVVAKIQLGEGDAGIVYSSDVTAQLLTLDIPDRFNVLATYPIAALKNAPQANLAEMFVEYVLSDKGQSILQKRGFLRIQ